MHRPIPYDSGLNLFRLKYGDKYIGGSHPAPVWRGFASPEPAELVLKDTAEEAIVFEQLNWGCGSNFLYAPAYRKYVKAEPDGKISLSSDEPFTFIVFENFTIGTENAVRSTDTPRNANCVELTEYWNDEECGIKLYCFGNRNVYVEDGKLKTDPVVRRKPESNTKEGGNIAEAWAGSEKEASTLTVEIVSNGIERATEIAKKAKKVIVALGCNPMMNAKEEIDRSTIEMIPLQEKLLEAVYAVNPNVAVVLITNYPYAINWMQEHVPAILTNATGSQDLGDEDLPPLEDYDLISHPRTYRYFDKPVLYPFGYGLSYTTFGYSGLRVEKNGGGLKASVTVTNTGTVTGDEVAQLYIQRISPSGTAHPIRRLIGFERLRDLAPGESREVSFTVNPCDLEIYMETEGKKIVEPGTYRVFAGGNCLDERVSAEIEL